MGSRHGRVGLFVVKRLRSNWHLEAFAYQTGGRSPTPATGAKASAEIRRHLAHSDRGEHTREQRVVRQRTSRHTSDDATAIHSSDGVGYGLRRPLSAAPRRPSAAMSTAGRPYGRPPDRPVVM